MRGKKRPASERVAAVALAEVRGVNAASAATGVPSRTIRVWMDRPEFAELRTKTRDELAEGFQALAHLAMTRLLEQVQAGEVEARDLTILLGVATDKHLLMRGDPTVRSEVSTFHGYNDHEKRAIADLLRKALAGDGADAGPALDAGGDAVVGAGQEGAATA